MPIHTLEHKKRRLTLQLTPKGRLRAALWSIAFVFSASSLTLSLFFLPDFLNDYAAQNPGYTRFFFSFVLSISSLFAITFGLMKGLAQQRWTFDYARNTLQYWAKTAFGRTVEAEIPFRSISDLALHRAPFPLAKTRIILCLGEDEKTLIAETRLNPQALIEIHTTLTQTLKRKGLSLPSTPN